MIRRHQFRIGLVDFRASGRITSDSVKTRYVPTHMAQPSIVRFDGPESAACKPS